MSEQLRRVTIIHVLPLFLIPIISSLLSNLVIMSGILEDVESPFIREEGVTSLTHNLITFGVMFVPTVVLIYLLVKGKMILLLKLIFALSLAFAFATVTDLYLEALLIVFNVYEELYYLALVLSILAALQAVYIAFRDVPEAYEALVCFTFGVAVGTFFANLLPLWSVIVLSLLISIYDLYAVFYGPLKRLIELEKEIVGHGSSGTGTPKAFLLRGMTVPFFGFRVGLGDIIFYSMIITSAYMNPRPSIIRSLITTVGIAIGAYITLRILTKKRRAMPAMPIPSLISISLLIILLFIGF